MKELEAKSLKLREERISAYGSQLTAVSLSERSER